MPPDAEFTAGLTANGDPEFIAAGPDGSMWFTEFNNPARMGRITIGPGALTGAASDVSSSAAIVTGAVSPNSQLTTFQFEYGTTTSYGALTPLQSAGQDAGQHPVSAALAGLSPGTTYHYRLLATNQSDTTVGADSSFSTAPAAAARAPDKASFAGSRSTITVNRKRRFRFGFHATPRLDGSAAFKSVNRVDSSHRGRVTLARKRFTVPASGKVDLRITLSKKSFRLLTRNRKIRTRVTVTLTNAAGTSTASKTITLKAPKRGR